MLLNTTVPAVFQAPGADPALELAHHIEEIVHRDGWNQPTRLFFVTADQVGGMAALNVRKFPVPEEAAAIHPVGMLALIASVVRDMPASGLDFLSRFAGAAIVTEYWGVRCGGEDEAVAREGGR